MIGLDVILAVAISTFSTAQAPNFETGFASRSFSRGSFSRSIGRSSSASRATSNNSSKLDYSRSSKNRSFSKSFQNSSSSPLSSFVKIAALFVVADYIFGDKGEQLTNKEAEKLMAEKPGHKLLVCDGIIDSKTNEKKCTTSSGELVTPAQFAKSQGFEKVTNTVAARTKEGTVVVVEVKA